MSPFGTVITDMAGHNEITPCQFHDPDYLEDFTRKECGQEGRDSKRPGIVITILFNIMLRQELISWLLK